MTFIVFSDLSTHFEKLRKCFLKCRKFGINLNPDKCAFMVFSRTILGSKEGKVMDPKKVETFRNIPIPTTPQ
jgi:CRISPR/Cas system-associated protein endoribonuclease Cas2